MAAMRPSIMSDGAMTSIPATAWFTAWVTRMATLSSLWTYSPAVVSRMTPSCPWSV